MPGVNTVLVLNGCRDRGMERWRDGEMEGWRDGGVEGCRDGGWRDAKESHVLSHTHKGSNSASLWMNLPIRTITEHCYLMRYAWGFEPVSACPADQYSAPGST